MPREKRQVCQVLMLRKSHVTAKSQTILLGVLTVSTLLPLFLQEFGGGGGGQEERNGQPDAEEYTLGQSNPSCTSPFSFFSHESK